MSQNEQTENIQHCFAEFDGNKCAVWKDLRLKHQSENAKAHCYLPSTKVVPVIFLPGIMGFNLRSKKDKKSIWRIRTSKLGMAVDALGWLFTSGNKRKKLLDPETTETNPTQDVDKNDNESTYFANSRQKRGWGSVLQFSYADPLDKLQKELLVWEQYYNKAKSQGCATADEAEEYFSQESTFKFILDKPLTPEDTNPLSLREAGKYRDLLLPLHAFGYNWLQDNAQSAQDLGKYIDEVLNLYRPKQNGGIGHGLAFEEGHEKVILVTHSMGGLVSRYASELLDTPYKDKILGIVHGVMPDLGSPTAYKMMKIGEHSMPMGLVLGMSASRLMSVLAQSPAPLQLLPSPKYNHGQPWLRIEKGSPDGVADLLLPQKGEPFNEIYLKEKAWWQMYEPDILDKEQSVINGNFKKYEKIMADDVEPFITKMDGSYHANTYQFYGAYFDENDPKDSRRSDETVTWKLRDKTSWLWVSDDSRATGDYGEKREYTLLKSSDKWKNTPSMDYEGGRGDGTVPKYSINLVRKDLFKEILEMNVDHQNAYQFAPLKGDAEFDTYEKTGDVSPAIKFTLRSLCRILQTDEVRP
ncbi:lipase family alpha/beta hydrolase [Providencia vermicola]|uniref:lipase family alpha/beta hydrolase n=1 Tax=Providencia vermicola TaxID=333965 RepID=UPI0034DDB3DA